MVVGICVKDEALWKCVIVSLYGADSNLGKESDETGNLGTWGKIVKLDNFLEKYNLSLSCLFSKELGDS